jgi:hypothetical protein
MRGACWKHYRIRITPLVEGLIDRKKIERLVSEPRWLWGFLVAAAISFLAYEITALTSEITPGNWLGLTFGWLSALLMYAVSFYAIRRRMLDRGLGRSKVWLQFHLYGGTLSSIFVLMHTGFSLPSGVMNWGLWILSMWVTVSGLFGVLLQRWIPKVLASGLSVEAIYERIPQLVDQVRERARDIVELCSDPVKDFYRVNIAPALTAPTSRLIFFLDVTGGIQSQLGQFDYLRRVVPPDEKERLYDLQELYKTKLELDAHYTLQKPLRWWLYTHVPLSLVLLVLILLHIYVVWYF